MHIRSVEQSDGPDIEATMVDWGEPVHVDLASFTAVEVEDLEGDASRG